MFYFFRFRFGLKVLSAGGNEVHYTHPPTLLSRALSSVQEATALGLNSLLGAPAHTVTWFLAGPRAVRPPGGTWRTRALTNHKPRALASPPMGARQGGGIWNVGGKKWQRFRKMWKSGNSSSSWSAAAVSAFPLLQASRGAPETLHSPPNPQVMVSELHRRAWVPEIPLKKSFSLKAVQDFGMWSGCKLVLIQILMIFLTISWVLMVIFFHVEESVCKRFVRYIAEK